ncbi:MAG: PilT/PilU family type 4a pilus ATPase [Opitutae bacterium]|jgi:twitching motility protein PilT|nr:PilT/PilU family type 4a pilus ATPase [Opitutae bacterium]MBT5377460.1 PilT/PilU family type 4a pilus ATPase [Opitutae bacterium]MBT5691042.1 PilT/PilU family type 4a pilus ATPase [Opitutae bacterium]MBT6462068.1 PilT/PilU family type 4a pilus ATPase [Opitutae bacterium]MBT6958984.1 PilT/PilU family type 4a pilus ATPase [Opitutae bacterium]
MEQNYDLESKVYPVGDDYVSMADLLRWFTSEEHMVGNMSRMSDVHVKVGRPFSYRFDDEMEVIPHGEPLTQEIIEALIFPLLTERNCQLLQSGDVKDLDCGFSWEEGGVNFRINIFHDRDGLAMVMRMLSSHVPSISEVGFPYDSVWEDIVGLKQGLCLVTGVTGSGKSTTIASLIEHINQERKTRIITLEDPIEFVFESKESMISQREIGNDVASFSAGLRSALRENPDIIFIGEMRDQETAGLALSAAETGHLVFSTLHTRDTKGAISRIVDMFPAEQAKGLALQLSFSIGAVISQKLIPREDGQGRVVAMEVLRNTSGLGNVIRTQNLAQVYSMLETQKKEGMQTMEQHLVDLYAEGVISYDNAVNHANDLSILDQLKEYE